MSHARPPSGTPRWRGLTVDDRGLRYQPPGLLRWRPRLQLSPDGLVVVPRSGDATLLVWDGSPDEWRLVGVTRDILPRDGIRVVLGYERGSHERGPHDVWLPSTWSPAPLRELPALSDFLAATPRARRGLGERERVTRLVGQLAQLAWRLTEPPAEPLMGDPLDVHIAVGRALSDANWRRFGGRPVRGEPRPDLDDTTQRVRSLLSRQVAGRVTRHDVEEAVRRHLEVSPWPFDVLV